MIPKSVWNKAVFIDGDIGLERCAEDVLNSFRCDFPFKMALDTSTVKERRKSLRFFKQLISNTALLNFSKYMAFYDETIASSLALRLQIAIATQKAEDNSKITEAFQNAGVNADTNALIAKYL